MLVPQCSTKSMPHKITASQTRAAQDATNGIFFMKNVPTVDQCHLEM